MHRYGLRHTTADPGFSLVELLVVIMIVGILAAIAIPLFVNQAAKADDAAAKSQLNTAATTMQACATDRSSSYTNCSLATIQADEPSLSDVSQAVLSVVSSDKTGYELTSSVVGTGDVFTLADSNGLEIRSCTAANAAPADGGCSDNTW